MPGMIRYFTCSWYSAHFSAPSSGPVGPDGRVPGAGFVPHEGVVAGDVLRGGVPLAGGKNTCRATTLAESPVRATHQGRRARRSRRCD